MSEVMPRRRLDAVPTASEVDLIEIALKDVVLRVVSLHLERGRLLAELAARAQIPAIDDVRMHVADELLRNRAAAAAIVADDLAEHRARYRASVDAVVLIEALIFDRDERLWHVPRQRLQRDAVTNLAADVADERAVASEHAR